MKIIMVNLFPVRQPLLYSQLLHILHIRKTIIDKCILFFILATAGLFFCGCGDDQVTSPEPVYGWQGTITNDSGKVIQGVQIYCLYYYEYIPSPVQKNIAGSSITDSVFQNNLYQNIPNPVTGDTYIRFSVRNKSYVELSLRSRLTGEAVYNYSDTLDYGLYQHFPGSLVSDPDIKNGIYDYTLKIIPPAGDPYENKKDLILIGSQNKPNAVSNEKGYYLFDIREAFVGEVVKEVSIYNPLQISERIIPEEVFLLFRKEGYQDEVIKYHLLPGVLFTRDIILTGVVK